MREQEGEPSSQSIEEEEEGEEGEEGDTDSEQPDTVDGLHAGEVAANDSDAVPSNFIQNGARNESQEVATEQVPDALRMDELRLSDHERPLSRSPPQSRRHLDLDHEGDEEEEENKDENDKGTRNDLKSIVSADIHKKRAQQQRKYHSKRSTRNAGRPQGSKAKQDKRVKLSEHAGWD